MGAWRHGQSAAASPPQPLAASPRGIALCSRLRRVMLMPASPTAVPRCRTAGARNQPSFGSNPESAWCFIAFPKYACWWTRRIVISRKRILATQSFSNKCLLLLLSPEMMFYRNRYVCKPGGTLHMHALIFFLKPACSDIDIQSYGYTSSNNR